MSVVQITKACTLKCTYCFDIKNQEDAKKKKVRVTLSRDWFERYLQRMGEFFQNKKDDKNICISWGEPSIHPHFINYIKQSLATNFDIYLLSNFTFNEKVQRFLKPHIESGRITTMVNVNSPTGTYAWMSKWLWIKTMMNLTALQNPGVRLSFNLFSPDEDYSFILQTLKKLPKVDKVVRLWISNPIIKDLREKGTYIFDKNILNWEKESMWSFYQRLWKTTDRLVKELSDEWYSIYLDCWVGWCIFSPETIELIKENKWVIHDCSLPNDEVSTDMQYSACYTLYNYGNEDRFLTVDNYSVKKSRWWFILKTEFFKEHYLTLPKCQRCPMLEKGCPRFCVSNNIKFWEKVYWMNWENLFWEYSDEYFDKLTKEELMYSRFEYTISRGLYDLGYHVLEYYKDKEDFRKDLYQIFLDYLTEKIWKKEALEIYNSTIDKYKKMNYDLSRRDFMLMKTTSIFIKEYKKIREIDDHNTHNITEQR